ncbi:histidine phosphatase family protein [Azohydromonas caseinilytica]|uniref:Histidine phosphatase family protein n=1 Tax=Azohydromonas caseinilytica TaxID=2728836 RepID=A0A848FHR9_9BURK|nr:histidine phosphatase family protein [Azohydromonas caseinilytica]NML17750.1 histidine phosphatase family protein [Azohydromonas caseinilytica]
MPPCIQLIRHAEEPDAYADIRGVDERGHPDNDALSVRGWQRAGALVHLFAPATGWPSRPPLARPAALFAATDAGKSRRPWCTLQPLAQQLKLPVDARFGSEGDPSALLDAVRACDGPVLIAWRHQSMADIARALAGEQAPRAWDADRYDLVWVFEPQESAWRFTELSQRLLAGDH